MKRRRGIAGILLTISAASAGGAAWSGGVFRITPSVVESSRLRTAVLSPRRAPQALVAVVADTRLASRVEKFAAAAGGATCVAIDAGTRSVVRRNEAQPLIPASTLKILTARAVSRYVQTRALSFSTDLFGRRPNAEGVVDGDLTLVGTGDPLLSTPEYIASLRNPLTAYTDLTRLAERLVQKGVRRVTGGIVGADNYFDRERYVPTWKAAYAREGDVGPIGALVVNDGFVSFGPRPVPASDPALHAAETLRLALVAKGVVVDGASRLADFVGSKDSLDALPGPAIPVLLSEMLTESDNNTAELLAKSLASDPANRSDPATRAKGLAAIRAALRAERLPVEDLTAVDSSGLDRGDRATCRLLLAALQPTDEIDLTPMLALAGRTGTLFNRFKGNPLEAKMRAKTGSLDGVTGLVGVADADAKVPLRFAFLANGAFSESGGRQLQERLGAILATYPEAPVPSAVRS